MENLKVGIIRLGNGAECESIIINYFRKFSGNEVKIILDVGCGTGSHSIRFAEKGYRCSNGQCKEIPPNKWVDP